MIKRLIALVLFVTIAAVIISGFASADYYSGGLGGGYYGADHQHIDYDRGYGGGYGGYGSGYGYSDVAYRKTTYDGPNRIVVAYKSSPRKTSYSYTTTNNYGYYPYGGYGYGGGYGNYYPTQHGGYYPSAYSSKSRYYGSVYGGYYSNPYDYNYYGWY